MARRAVRYDPLVRQTVQEEVKRFDLYDFEGSIDEVVALLRRAADEHPGARIVKEYGRFHDDSDYFAVKISRPENDAEYLARLERERQHTAVQEERERQEYVRLKAKFEG